LDRFPEAFERFAEVVDVDAINSFGELRLAFSLLAGEKRFGASFERCKGFSKMEKVIFDA